MTPVKPAKTILEGYHLSFVLQDCPRKRSKAEPRKVDTQRFSGATPKGRPGETNALR